MNNTKIGVTPIFRLSWFAALSTQATPLFPEIPGMDSFPGPL